MHQPRPIVATTRKSNVNNTNTSNTSCQHADHQGSKGYHYEADTVGVSHHTTAAATPRSASSGGQRTPRSGANNSRNISVSATGVMQNNNSWRSGSVQRRGNDYGAGVVTAPTSLSTAPVAATAEVFVSFAADPSLNMILSHNDYKALTMSMAQKPNVTSLSLQGNILSNAAILSLCGEISSISCRLTSLNLSMCGLGNDSAVRIVAAAVAGVHNRKVTINNPQGTPTVLGPTERRQARDRHVDYLRMNSATSYARDASSNTGRTPRSASSSNKEANEFTVAGPRRFSSRASPDTSQHYQRSTSAQSRSGSVVTTRTCDAVGTYGYAGGIRVLDLSLNHITNAGAVAIAEALNDAALAADLNSPSCPEGGAMSGGSMLTSTTTTAYSRSPSAVSSAYPMSITASLSERRAGSALRSASVNGRGSMSATANSVRKSLGGGAASGGGSVVMNSGEGDFGLQVLVLRFNRIGATGVQRLLRATSDLRVLDMRYCGMNFVPNDDSNNNTSGHDASAASADPNSSVNTTSSTSYLGGASPRRKVDDFAALQQGITDARTVQRLLLDGNAFTGEQIDSLNRLLAISTSGSLRAEGVSAAADTCSAVGPLPAIAAYIRAKRPSPGTLYPPAVVEEAAIIGGEALYVRGELRDAKAKVPFYSPDGRVVGSTVVSATNPDGLPAADNEENRSRSISPGSKARRKSTLVVSKRASRDAPRTFSRATSRTDYNGNPPPLCAPQEPTIAVRRSASSANREHVESGNILTKLTASRIEGVEVSTSVAERVEQSLGPVSNNIAANNHHHAAAGGSNTNSPARSDHLLTITAGMGGAGGGPAVSRRGLMMEDGWERPVCAPCPIVDTQKLAKALASEQRVGGSPFQNFSGSRRRLSGGVNVNTAPLQSDGPSSQTNSPRRVSASASGVSLFPIDRAAAENSYPSAQNGGGDDGESESGGGGAAGGRGDGTVTVTASNGGAQIAVKTSRSVRADRRRSLGAGGGGSRSASALAPQQDNGEVEGDVYYVDDLAVAASTTAFADGLEASSNFMQLAAEETMAAEEAAQQLQQEKAFVSPPVEYEVRHNYHHAQW